MPDRDLVAGVMQLANLLTRRLAPIFAKGKITPQQWAVLSVLGESEQPMTLAAVARRLLVSKQNMTGMMTRLEQLGLADRSDDPKDLRSSRVQLTRRGRTLVERMRPAYEEWLASLGEEFSEKELSGLTRTLERLIARLESAP
ncbi:MAG TPA: MarR family transcriptional regulator [Thermoanaerobaculia bacterium]|nr:MarR family transcriptional regulator [Thermoanaerobaculia bacterium]